MSSLRLRARTPSARLVDTGLLRQHQLIFHKHSLKDGSAKCDAHFTGNEEDIVYGVIFEIDTNEKYLLDVAEGLGSGYQEKEVEVELENGNILKTFTYYAIRIKENLKPYSWYKEHVLKGAHEHQLPQHYVSILEQVEAIEDNNQLRHQDELAIYQSTNTP